MYNLLSNTKPRLGSGLFPAWLLLLMILAAGCAPTSPQTASWPDTAIWQDEPRLADLFAEAGVNGVFVLYDREKNILHGCNAARAATRYQPASTFKMLNALIAFETGTVSDADEILPYGGGTQPIKAWERDMTIKEAMAVSNVPLFQGIARRIGLERMRGYVRKAAYGNAEIGNEVDIFWLKGPLAISALEQIRFIDALNRDALPFSRRSLELLRAIMPQKNGPTQASVYFYKTGLTSAARPGIGWVVGWARKNGRDYPFALNLDITKDTDADLRLPLAREALRTLGI